MSHSVRHFSFVTGMGWLDYFICFEYVLWFKSHNHDRVHSEKYYGTMLCLMSSICFMPEKCSNKPQKVKAKILDCCKYYFRLFMCFPCLLLYRMTGRMMYHHGKVAQVITQFVQICKCVFLSHENRLSFVKLISKFGLDLEHDLELLLIFQVCLWKH